MDTDYATPSRRTHDPLAYLVLLAIVVCLLPVSASGQLVPLSDEELARSRAASPIVRSAHDSGRLSGSSAVTPVVASAQLPQRLGRAEALEASATRFRLGRSLAETGRATEARQAFDESVEVLLRSEVDFAADAGARYELESLLQEIHRIELTRLGSEVGSQPPFYQPVPFDELPELTFPVDPNLEATAVDLIRARSGDFPLEVNDVVLSYVRFFTSVRGRRTYAAGYRRSGRYRDMIYRILDEEGLPRELLFLAQAESGFQPRAMSRARAGGLWQFISSSGKEYGLSQTKLTDDRFDPEQATRAAARHLRDLYDQFGDWNLAMAAYNCGPACVSRAVERTGYADFWELRKRNAIPRETTNYVPIVQALAIISLNPEAYGLELPELDPPVEFDTHQLEANTNLGLVADLLGVTKAELRDLNPAVSGDLAPAHYTLRVPRQMVPTMLSGLQSIPADKRTEWRAHRVTDGDTLEAIASQYKVPEGEITKTNEVLDDNLQAGDLLLIPATYTPPPPPKPATRKAPARKSAAKKPTTARPAAKKPATKRTVVRKASTPKPVASTSRLSTSGSAASR